MSVPVVLDGIIYQIPETGETDWGYETTDYLVALSKQPTSGSAGPLPLGLVSRPWTFHNDSGEAIFSSPVGPVLLGAANNTPCVIFTSADWGVYALRVTDGSVFWRHESAAMCYGRCQWATLGGQTFVFAPCHTGGMQKLSNVGALVAQYPSIYEDPTRVTGTISASTLVSPGLYEVTTSLNRYNAGPNMYRRPNAAENAVFQFGSIPTDGTVDSVVATNKIRALTSVAPAIGDSYSIIPRYESDTIFMHAGTINIEGPDTFIYLTGFDNCIRKVNAATMAEVWIRASLENIEPYPLLLNVDGGLKCFAVSIDNNLYRLNATTGAVDWATDCGLEQAEGLDSFTNVAPLNIDGRLKVLVSSRDARIYVVDAITGVREDKTTTTYSWVFDDINSSPVPVKLPGETRYRVVTGGDAGTVWCFDYQMNTLWSTFVVPNEINSSSCLHDVMGDGRLVQIVGDMRGTLHFTRVQDGVSLGALYFKGGIEGWPYYGDIDGDGKTEMIVTTTDGYVVMLRFVNGGVYDDAATRPGNTRFTGTANRT